MYFWGKRQKHRRKLLVRVSLLSGKQEQTSMSLIGSMLAAWEQRQEMAEGTLICQALEQAALGGGGVTVPGGI